MTTRAELLKAAVHDARALWHRVGCPPSPIDVEAVACVLGHVVVYDELVGAAARVTTIGSRGCIRVPATGQSAARLRFGIAHEIGHIVLHRASSTCSVEDLENPHTDRDKEHQANAFAAELLMPDALLLRAIQGQSGLSMAVVEDIAKTFAVSLTAAACRLVGASGGQCAAVLCEGNGNVIWPKGSQGLYRRILPSAPRDSLARRALTSPAGSFASGRRCWASDWCAPCAARDFELWEEVKPMPNRGQVLVFLSEV